jgi:hypothetical protein
VPGPERNVQIAYAPLPVSLGTPVNTKPATAAGIFNNTVGTSAEKILSASTTNVGRGRRIKLHNPDPAKSLAFTTVLRGAAAPTLTAGVAATATDGCPVPPGATEWFILSEDSDLYLAGSAAGSPYSLTIFEVER